jgi:hypothetical protein
MEHAILRDRQHEEVCRTACKLPPEGFPWAFEGANGARHGVR